MQEIEYTGNLPVTLGTHIDMSLVLIHSCGNNWSTKISKQIFFLNIHPYICEALTLCSPWFACTCFMCDISDLVKEKSRSHVYKQTMVIKCPSKCMASGVFC